MKEFTKDDIKILKDIINKTNKDITAISNLTLKIEEIQEAYRIKCEEKTKAIEEKKEALLVVVHTWDSVVREMYDCTLEEAREKIYGNEEPVVVDTPQDDDEEPEVIDDNLTVIDEDEVNADADDSESSDNTIANDAQELADLTMGHESPEFIDELVSAIDNDETMDDGDMEEEEEEIEDDDEEVEDDDAFPSDEQEEEESEDNPSVVAAAVSNGWDEDSLFAQFN